MKKLFLLFITFTVTATFCTAQENAGSILDKVSSVFNKDNGIKAEFKLQVTEQGRPKGESNGTIRIKGDKFVMETPSSTTWFNGKTLWSYLPTTDEVNISTPGKEELQSINPYLLLNNYKKEFSSALGSKKTFRSKPVYEVILTPSGSKNNDIASITVYVDKQTYRPLYIDVMQNNGLLTKITVDSYQVKQSFADALFIFDKTKYPDAEEIDLR